MDQGESKVNSEFSELHRQISVTPTAVKVVEGLDTTGVSFSIWRYHICGEAWRGL